MTGHLDFARLASLAVDHQAALLHLSRCESCQVRVAEQLEPSPPRPRQEPNVEAALRRLIGQLEHRQHFTDRIEALGQERREAIELVQELRTAPDSWGTAGSDLRYASPEVVWQLLETAKDEEPTCALRIIALAEEIVHNLSAVLPPPPTSLCQQLAVEVRCARAENLIDSGFHTAASKELRSAAAALAPDLGHGRAIYCRVLARLRREQKRWDEAIALADRAVSLLDDFGSTFEAAQAQIEQGWILLEAGDATEAVPLLSAALQLVGMAPAWRLMGQLGLGMAEALHGHPKEAEKLLAEADAGLPGVSSLAARLRLRWISGQVAQSCGHRCSAFRRFCRTAVAFVTLGEEHTGALALLDLMAFCTDCGWPPRLLEIRGIEEALVLLMESPQLHRRAQRVLDFAVYAFRQQRRGTREVLVNARRYLVRSRYYPQLQFLPTRTSGGLCLEWDQLELALRRTVCAEVEVDTSHAENPAGALPVDLQDRISWRYELACRTRILFIPSSRPA